MKSNNKSTYYILYFISFLRSQFANWGIKKLMRVEARIKKGVQISNFLICAEKKEIDLISSQWEKVKHNHPLRRMIQSRKIYLIKSDFPIYGFALPGITFFTVEKISEAGFENLLLQCAYKNYIDRHREQGILGTKNKEIKIKQAFLKYCKICGYDCLD